MGRFLFQETFNQFVEKKSQSANWGINIGLSLVTCGAWGYLLYTGNINTLWRMLGIANQLLASIALGVGTIYLLKTASKKKYALFTGIPFCFVLVTTLTASVISIHGWQAAIPTANPETAISLKIMSTIGIGLIFCTIVITLDILRILYKIFFSRVTTLIGEV